MRIEFTVIVTDDLRAAIGRYYGTDLPASDQEVRLFFEMHGQAGFEDLADV